MQAAAMGALFAWLSRQIQKRTTRIWPFPDFGFYPVRLLVVAGIFKARNAACDISTKSRFYLRP
jgi:hypothetical protein